MSRPEMEPLDDSLILPPIVLPGRKRGLSVWQNDGDRTMKTSLKAVSGVDVTLALSPSPGGEGSQAVSRLEMEPLYCPSRLDFGVRLPRPGDAPAEPHPPVSVSPGSRLRRSFALPGGTDVGVRTTVGAHPREGQAPPQILALTRHSPSLVLSVGVQALACSGAG